MPPPESPAPPPSPSALDKLLDHCASIGFGYTDLAEDARAEVAALRSRAPGGVDTEAAREQMKQTWKLGPA